MLDLVTLKAMNFLYGVDAPEGGLAGPFARIRQAITEVGNNLKFIFPAVAVLMIIIAALAFLGGRKGSEWAKGKLSYVAIAVAIICLAGTAVTWGMQIFGGATTI